MNWGVSPSFRSNRRQQLERWLSSVGGKVRQAHLSWFDPSLKSIIKKIKVTRNPCPGWQIILPSLGQTPTCQPSFCPARIVNALQDKNWKYVLSNLKVLKLWKSTQAFSSVIKHGIQHVVCCNTDRCWKTGRPYLLLLAGQGPIHFHYRNVVLKKTETRRVTVVLPKNWGMCCQPAEVLVAQNLSENHKNRDLLQPNVGSPQLPEDGLHPDP